MRFQYIIILFIFCSSFLKAQNPTYYLNPDKKITQYNFDHWTTDNGLPTNSLLYIIQSSQGYLYLSGYSGLIRYDGSKFKVFNNVNTETFNSNVIRNLTEDSKGKLWMNTQGNGLVSLYKGQFESFGNELNMLHLYRGLLADNKDRIWGASPERGWFYLENGEFHFIEYSSSLKNIEVRAIVQSKSGAIWFATLGEGLFKYENGKLKRYSVDNGLINNWVYSLYFDSDDNLWIGTSKGMSFYDGYRFKNVVPEITTTVNKILKDKYGNLWVGSIDGLYRKNVYNNNLEYVTSANGLLNNYIVDFVFDNEGSLWITHYKGGLTRMKDGKFTNYTKEGGLPGKLVNTVCEINDSTLLVGIDNGKLVKLVNGKILPYSLKNDLEGDRIRNAMISKNGYLWLSTYSGLLNVSPDGEEKWFNESNGFLGTKIRLSFQDSRNNIWVGTRNNGIIKITQDLDFKSFHVENGLSSNLIMAVEEDIEGNIWVGTSEGDGALTKIDQQDNVYTYNDKTGFNSDIVFNIYSDNDGVIWFATVDGLWYLKEAVFYSINTRKGLADNSVFDIVEDDLGYLWMPFARGVMKIKKDDVFKLQNQLIDKIDCRVYNKYDGMPNSECNPTSQALKGSDGKIYFPTLNGLSSIDPNDEIINNYIPPVIIEHIKVDNETVAIKEKYIFEPGNKRYTFNYTALSLYEPEKVNFKYQLEGFEDTWVETSERSVSYTNLQHGDYTFKVKASNNDNVWNETGVEIKISIKPKFTETRFFYILLLIASFSIIYMIYIYRVSQLKLKHDLLEKKIGKRTSEIVEQNLALEFQKEEIQKQNDVLQNQKNEIEKHKFELEQQQDDLKESNASKDKIFSIISHDLRSPLGNIRNMLNLLLDKSSKFNDEKRERILENLAELTRSTFYLLDNLLNWSRSKRGLIAFDPQMFIVAPIFNDILNLTILQAEKKNINITTSVGESDLVFGDKNMVMTIFRNIVENAIKFTPEGGEIQIQSKISEEYIEFSIADSGVGMSEERIHQIINSSEINATFGTNREKGSGLGLLLCKDFIDKNRGVLRIESEMDKGSIFSVSLKRFQL